MKKYIKKKRLIDGSFTLEAAILLPFILFVIIALIYLSFYMHDRIKIQNSLDQAARKAENIIRYIAEYDTGNIDYESINERTVLWPVTHNYDNEKVTIEASLKRELGKGLFIADVNEINVELDYSEINISVSTNFSIPFSMVKILLAPKKQKYTSTLSVHRPAEFVRIFTVFSDTASGIDGAEEAIKGIQRLIKGGE
ncbi:MAG TPA: TadE family protein [Lachnospiraceae bacterium]|nr:TadE family protein [Lachnospiraceae bacterium]